MNNLKRLKVYLEVVTKNLTESTGALKEFWEREFRKTSSKIENLK